MKRKTSIVNLNLNNIHIHVRKPDKVRQYFLNDGSDLSIYMSYFRQPFPVAGRHQPRVPVTLICISPKLLHL